MVKERRPWGDPKWTMRRSFVIAVCLFCALAFLLAMRIENPDKIRALGDLLTALAVIVMPVIISYLGIAEAGQVIRDIRTQQPGTQITETREVKQVSPVPVDDVKPPRGDQ